ncbi:sensor domain-containing protein [Cupriavidus pinatubonensis]|nr:EAL domain-containing protein [Cupriavidus pinatubonensis]
MVLMGWSNYRWDQALGESLIALDRLADSRRAATAAELHLERILNGDASSTRDLVIASLTRAREASQGLVKGYGQLAGFALIHPPTARIGEAAAAYAAELETMADAIRRRLANPATTTGLELRKRSRVMEETASALESIILRDTATRRLALHRLDALNIGLVGVLTLLLYLLLARTERRRARALEELTTSESHLHAIVSGLPGVSFLLDTAGRYLGVFGSETELLLEPAEVILQRQITDFLPAEAAAGCLKTIAETLSSRRTNAYEYRLTINGRERWFDARVAPVGDTDSVIWLAWDVTERREAEQRVRELSRLYGFLSHVNQASISAATRETLFERVCSAAQQFGGFRRAWVEEFDHVVAARCGGDPHPIDPGAVDSAAADPIDAWTRGEIVCFTGRAGDLAPDWAARDLAGGMSACAGIPLRCDQELIGVLHLASDSLDLTRSDEIGLLREIGGDISLALTRLDRNAKHAVQAARIQLLAAALESSRDGIMITDLDARIVSVNRAFTNQTGYTEAEAVGQTPRLLRSNLHPGEFYRAIHEALARKGYWHGEIWNQTKNGKLVPQFLSISTVPGTDGQAKYFVSALTDLTHLKQAEDRLDALTHFDPLTELPNRLLIRMRLEQALAMTEQRGNRLAVLFIDLDHFQTINDGLGHAVGDELLSAVAQRLQGLLRREDILGRQSGDEFVVVIHDIGDVNAAAEVARTIMESFAQPFCLPTVGELFAQVSIGVAVPPEDGSHAAELIRNAEAAMHEAKRSGRATWRSYAAGYTSAASSRLTLEARLRRALRQELFEIHYQPLVNLEDGRIIGAEALVRLRPDGGNQVGPAEFIPLLEETGMILPLGQWVQREVCRQGRQWLDEGREIEMIAVNLSAAEIRSGSVQAQLRDILAETGFPPERLELEVTESGLMSRGGQAAEFLRSLKALGIKLAIDDFGTGYSSLAYLRRFPVDKLKIDRSFIRYIPDETADMQLVATIVAMAKGLGLRVLAEGVETEAQRLFLERLGCDVWQGYLCSPPLPAADFASRFLNPGARL